MIHIKKLIILIILFSVLFSSISYASEYSNEKQYNILDIWRARWSSIIDTTGFAVKGISKTTKQQADINKISAQERRITNIFHNLRNKFIRFRLRLKTPVKTTPKKEITAKPIPPPIDYSKYQPTKYTGPAYAKGEVVVRFAPDVDVHMKRTDSEIGIIQTENFLITTGNEELDNYFNEKLKVIKFEKVFKNLNTDYKNSFKKSVSPLTARVITSSNSCPSDCSCITEYGSCTALGPNWKDCNKLCKSNGQDGICCKEGEIEDKEELNILEEKMDRYYWIIYNEADDKNKDPEKVSANLKTFKEIEVAEPDYFSYPAAQQKPDDPAVDSPGLFDSIGIQNRQEHLYDINAFSAWNNLKGNRGRDITIAIIDSGVKVDHEDLDAKIVKPWNVIDGNNVLEDEINHGTRCAGIAAAETNNIENGKFIGVAGVCPNCKIMPLDIATDIHFKDVHVANAIKRAAYNDAAVISCSLGKLFDSSIIKAAVEYAITKGSIIVAAAGNHGKEMHNYPASYDNVIGVAATRPKYSSILTEFSTWNDKVDIAAPGKGAGGITTSNDGKYDWFSGTSMSAPIVAGVVAILRSEAPSISLDQIKTLLGKTSISINKRCIDASCDKKENIVVSFGSLNFGKAITYDTDNDKLADIHEYRYGTDLNKPDTDGDKLTDGEEVNKYHTNPTKGDTDGDGLDDFFEVSKNPPRNMYITDPSNWDTDGDKISDGDETWSDPTKKDTDDDGLTDKQEIDYPLAENGRRLNPNNPDCDGDGLKDGEENNVHITDPLKKDTDSDTYSDEREVIDHRFDLGDDYAWSDPNNPNSIPINRGEEQPECTRDPDCQPRHICINERCVQWVPEPTEYDSDGDGFDDIFDCYPNNANKWQFPKFECCEQNQVYAWLESCEEYNGNFIPFDPSSEPNTPYEEYYNSFSCQWSDCVDICKYKTNFQPHQNEVWSGRQDAYYCSCYRISFGD